VSGGLRWLPWKKAAVPLALRAGGSDHNPVVADLAWR
jgi:hypothetical protein